MDRLKKHLGNNDFLGREYGKRIKSIFDKAVGSIMSDTNMVSVLKCPYNSESDVLMVFGEYLDNWVVMNVIEDTDDVTCMEMYNVITEPRLYSDFVLDLYDSVKEMLKS